MNCLNPITEYVTNFSYYLYSTKLVLQHNATITKTKLNNKYVTLAFTKVTPRQCHLHYHCLQNTENLEIHHHRSHFHYQNHQYAICQLML